MANLQNNVSAESLILFDAIAEKSVCHVCKNYLSFAPIKIVTGGYRICRLCNSPPSMVAGYRDTTLEAILNMILLPCCYKKEGCSRRVQFNQAMDHQSKCSYRTIFCPLACGWNGAVPKLPEHVRSNHKESVIETAIIELELKQDQSETLMVTYDAFLHFLIKYDFDSKTRSLEYDVRYQAVQGKCENVSFEVSYRNKAEIDSFVKLKSKTCPEFDESFSGMQNVTVVNLEKFCAALDYPDRIRMIIDYKFWELTPEGRVPVNVCNFIVD